jgi:hypothetical protein
MKDDQPSAKGAKCKSLGHRPRKGTLPLSALKARNGFPQLFRFLIHMSRLQRFGKFYGCLLGRWPRLLHLAVGACDRLEANLDTH